MTGDPAFLVVTLAAVTILGLSKGGFAGLGMVSTPMVAAASDPLTAVGPMLPIMLVQDAVAVLLYRRTFDPTVLARMIPGGLVGVVLAYLLAAAVPVWGVEAVLGVVLVVFSAWQAVVHVRGAPRIAVRRRFDRSLGIGAGVAGGFASAIAHAGSPPFPVNVMPRHLRKEVYVGTSVMFFAAINLMKVPSFAALGLFSLDGVRTSLLFLPVAVASNWLGARLVRVVDPRSFHRVITAILFALGLVPIWQAAAEALG